MSGLRRKWTRRTAQMTAVGLLAASGSMFFASTAFAGGAVKPPAPGGGGAGGNNGTVQINGDLITNGNDPHITCPIIFKWSGFDPAPTKDDYSVTVTGINPTGGTATFTAPAAGNPLTGTFTGPDFTLSGVQVQVNGGTANKKGEYHVNLTVSTKSAKGTDTKSKTVWLANCTPGAPAPSALTIAGACSQTTAGVIDWTVTNPNNSGVTNLAVDSNPAGAVTVSNLSGNTIAASPGTATFNTSAPLPNNTSMVATGVVNGQNVSSTGGTWSGGSCPIAGAPEVPASVSFADDCSGTTANFTSADQHTSTFTVTDPLGASSTVNGTTSKHYSANAGHKHTAITDDKGGSFSHDWVDPGNCAGGQADPQVTEANHCKSGMNVTLSNMNGTAPATFTVVDPDGTVQTITVNAGQLKKLVFAVKEDTTGTVSVTAVGGSKQQFIYKKNCATVLGVKHTRKPPHRPVTKPVVKGEHQQLPFTGFETQRALLGGSALFFLGAVLCIMGARRREEEPLYY